MPSQFIGPSIGGGGGGSGAPTDATYVVAASDATLSAEQVLGTTVITRAAYASRPAAASAGRLFFPSDGIGIDRDTGAAYNGYGPIYPTVDPNLKTWSWVNQDGASVSSVNGGITLTSKTGGVGGTDSLACRVTAVPATPYTIIVGCLFGVPPVNYASAGILWRESGSGKLARSCVFGISNFKWCNLYSKMNSPTSFNSNYADGDPGPVGAVPFFCLRDDGVNRWIGISMDGQNVALLVKTTSNDFLTPDQVGFYVDPPHDSGENGVTFLNIFSWRETA